MKLFSVALWVLAIGLFVLIAIRSINGMTVMDDAYMFLRYAHHLLEDQCWCWNPGESCYGTTSIIYTMLVIPVWSIFKSLPNFALWITSLSFGFILIFLMGWKYRNILRENPSEKPIPGLFLILFLIAAGQMTVANFTNGMDTSMAVLWITGWLFSLIQWKKRPETKTLVLVSFLGGMAWLARPDLMLLTLMVPGIIIVISGDLRKRALFLCGGTGFFFGIALLISFSFTGEWLPTAFYVKSSGIYGEAFTSLYKNLRLQEGFRFLIHIWPVMLWLLVETLIRIRNKNWKIDPVRVAVAISAFAFYLYYTFAVLQVMGMSQRFYMPLVPLLFWLVISSDLNIDPLELLKSQQSSAIIFGVLICLSITWTAKEELKAIKRWVGMDFIHTFDHEKVYEMELYDSWFALEQFSKLPKELLIAATEVGNPGIMNLDKVIIDLAGLNEPHIAKKGFSADWLMDEIQPDLIFMPHYHYEKMNAELREHPKFKSGYDLWTRDDLQTEFGIAIKKSSPWYDEMLQIMRDEVSKRNLIQP